MSQQGIAEQTQVQQQNVTGVPELQVQQVINAFQHALSGNPENLRAATLFLESQRTAPQYTILLMQIIDAPDNTMQVRQFSLTQLKATVESHWTDRRHQLSVEDKQIVREALLPLLVRVASDRALFKTQCKIIKIVCQHDYPQKWPGLVPQLRILLEQGQQYEQFLAALLVTKELVRNYEFMLAEDRKPLQELVNQLFPGVQMIVQKIQAQYTPQTASLLTQALRIFYHTVQLEVPLYFHENQDHFNAWLMLLRAIIELQPEEEPLPSGVARTWDQEVQAQRLPVWKNKKIAAKIAVRFMQRYSNLKLEDNWITQLFLSQYAEVLLQANLRTLYTARGGAKYVSVPVQHFAMKYIFSALRNDRHLPSMSIHLLPLVTEICLPLLRLSDHDLELWDSDPNEFMRKEEDFSVMQNNIKNTAMDLIDQICKKQQDENNKTQIYLLSLMQYLYAAMQHRAFAPSYSAWLAPEGGASALTLAFDDQMLDGLLWCLGNLRSVVWTCKPLRERVEHILEQFVLPLFNSDKKYLIARAIWLYGEYGLLEFRNVVVLQNVTRYIAAAMQHPDLIINIKAAIALNFVLAFEPTRALVRAELSALLEIYLSIVERVENEAVVQALEGIVTRFGDDLAPFALRLCTSLSAAFFRLCEREEAADDENDDGEAECAAAQTFSTVNRILSASLSPNLAKPLFEIVYPMIDKSLVYDNEFVEEAIECITLYVCKLDTIETPLWFYFSVLCYLVIGISEIDDTSAQINDDQLQERQQQLLSQLKLTEEQRTVVLEIASGWGTEYIEKLLPALKNFVLKAPQEILQGRSFLGHLYLDLLYRVADRVTEVGSSSYQDGDDADVVNVLHLLICLQENLGKHDAKIVYTCLQRVLYYTQQYIREPSSGYSIQVAGVLSLALHHDALGTLHWLQQQQHDVAALLERWEIAGTLMREHVDFQRQLLGVVALLKVPLTQVTDERLHAVFQKIVYSIVNLTTKALESVEDSDEEDDASNDKLDESDYADFTLFADYTHRYISPLYALDEVQMLEEQLETIRAQDPNYFAQLLSIFSQEQLETLKNNFQSAREMSQQQNGQTHTAAVTLV